MPRRRSHRSLGFVRLAPRQAEKAQRLCRMAQREQGEELLATCRKLRETLSQFGHEEPEARIRARACGCPVMR